MAQAREPYLVYLATKSGRVEELEDSLPRARLHGDYQKLEATQPVSLTDHLEYVDKQTGFTPLLAAVFWHRTQAARLLLEHGANVHNHGGCKTKQTPLHLAVADLNMDAGLIELLVSYGASPFLEASDGTTPLDEVVQLRQNRIVRIDLALGSVLLCLRRRCAFRGHLELKVDRYMGLSQTWRKFFCVLAPREKVAGYAADMQLLVFSKNGFESVTSILVTHAAPIQVPLKAAHGRVCFELVLSNRQLKKPSKLFAPGSSRVGYSIYVRALSRDDVEARWAHRFVNLATCDPNEAMLIGDSEHLPALRSRHNRPQQDARLEASADQHSQKHTQMDGQTTNTSSFSSDSAHVPLHHMPQLSEAADDQSELHSMPADLTTSGSCHPVQAPFPPPPSVSQVDACLSSHRHVQPHQQASAPDLISSSTAPLQRASSTQMWRSNAAFDGDKAIHGTSCYRSSLSLPSAKSFTSIDRHLTDHWRAKALQGLDDVQEGRMAAVRTPLPPVSEHALHSSLHQQPGFTSNYHPHAVQPIQQQQPQQQHEQQQQQQQHAASQPEPTAAPNSDHVLPGEVKLSHNPIFSSVPAPADSRTPSLLIESNLEAVRARSDMLDIPSAELLDSILDFANAFCGEPAGGGIAEEPEAPSRGEIQSRHSQPWGPARANDQPIKRRAGGYSTMSHTSAGSVEAFSDDDDVTILDTTEVKKLAPQPLQALPELPQLERSHCSASSRPPLPSETVVASNHLDSHGEGDLVYEMGIRQADVPFHHYSLSPHLMETPSPKAAARYGHINRMYDTSMSDASTPSHGMHQSHHSPVQPGIFDSSSSQSQDHLNGGTPIPQQQYFDIIEKPGLIEEPMAPVDFREMIDDIMAQSERQAAQVHTSGGAAAHAASLHPIWEDEEVCMEGHQLPCVATIGVCATR
ncbi:MAG: hypothetical protein FRX49_05005 [Trebouxia sp. A1-2]|nr:MAG: hypothetical protein FRX49_05005 [Trebouxia sp. A1-2]